MPLDQENRARQAKSHHIKSNQINTSSNNRHPSKQKSKYDVLCVWIVSIRDLPPYLGRQSGPSQSTSPSSAYNYHLFRAPLSSASSQQSAASSSQRAPTPSLPAFLFMFDVQGHGMAVGWHVGPVCFRLFPRSGSVGQESAQAGSMDDSVVWAHSRETGGPAQPILA